MPTEYAFRVSTYLSLALACACLGYAELELLPEVTAFMGVVLVLLAVSFRYEGRIELSLARANAVGLGIAVVGVAWLAVKATTPATGLMANLPWPTNILPYAGPVLMVLIPAKLFRPKHVGDWWAMQGVGLAAVGLAAAMSDDELFVAILSLYLFFAVLSLTLFYYRRSGGLVAPLPAARVWTPPGVVFAQANVNPDAPPPYQFAAGRCLRWIGYALLLAGPLFLLTPRNGAPVWGLASGRLTVGFNPEPTLEMNRSGDLQSSREVACEATVTDAAGQPKDDLESDPYWRGKAYRNYDIGRLTERGYEGGRWITGPQLAGLLGAGGPRKVIDEWRRAGREPFVVEVIPRRRVSTILLSPVAWVDGAESPVVSLLDGRAGFPWPMHPDGPRPPAGTIRERIRQTTVDPLEPGLSPGFRKPTDKVEQANWVAPLTGRVPDGIRALADRLLREWIRDGTYGLTPAVLSDARPGQCRVADAHREVVAVAFRQHLAGSGEYEYSTKLRRRDKALDPIEDFLVNVKEGHCEWFASGYVLLLRGVGVPCQFVTGFRGYEAIGDGRYQILQEHAHAWAEVLIERTDASGTTTWHWLTVDPTVAGGGAAATDRGWWSDLRQAGAAFIADYILGYNPEKRQKAINDAVAFAADWWPVLIAGAALLVAWRTRRRWWPSAPAPAPHPLVTSATPPWFLDYLTAIAELGRVPPTGQTPREFAEVVAAALRGTPAGAPVAEVPAFVTSKFYRVRYGGTPLTAGEEAEVRAAVDRLVTAVHALSVLPPAA